MADHIALDAPKAARRLVKRLFRHGEQRRDQPESGSVPKEFRPKKTYRQLVEKPCRVFYRLSGETIFIVHIMRGERVLGSRNLRRKN